MAWKQWALLAASVSAMALAACSNDNNGDDVSQNAENSDAAMPSSEGGKVSGPAVPINEEVENEGESIEGGTLKVGLVSDAPFQGVFSNEFSTDATDGDLMEFMHESLFWTEQNGMIIDGGLANQEIDEENKTVTYHLREGVKWSDGEPFTADDVIFSNELIASPDYTGLRYDPDQMENVIGVEEFHDGKADHIEGIEKVDDHTVKFHLKEINISLKYGSGGPWGFVAPKHVLENIPIDQIESSPEIREHPVGLGPFRVAKIVPGESIEFEANEYYYQGRPKLDKVEVTRVPTSGAVPALENHKYDYIIGMPTSAYDTYQDISGYTLLTSPSRSYGYLGFKLGKYDKEKGENVPDPDSKLANPKLRQALGYAIDNDLISERFYHGLAWNANSKLWSELDLYDKEQPGFYYDPEKAKQLLDEAGYKDVNGDGYVEDPDGNELLLHLAASAGSETAEPVANYYLQAWKEIGVHVELTDGRLQDQQSYFDRIESDDPAIDLFTAGWSLGSDPWPGATEGRMTPLNYTRYATDEQDQLLAAMISEQAFHDPEYQKEQYKKWQQYIVDDPQSIPLRYGLGVAPINKRVKHFKISADDREKVQWHQVELTADEPLGE